MKKRWITFDLDGTLMQNPFMSWVFPEIDKIIKEETPFKSNIREHLIAEHNRLMGNNLMVEAYNWDEILKEVLLNNGLHASIDIEDIVKNHSIHPKIYLLEDGTLDALKVLKEKGYSLAAVTNGYTCYQLPVLNALNLSPLFDSIITPEKVGYGKPNIKMVDRLMNDDNMIVAHVGDRIDHDIVFANELGISSVLLYKAMPSSLKKIDPISRKQSDLCIVYCKNKWHKETNNDKAEFSTMHIPEIVIHSIHELADCLKGIQLSNT